MNLSYPQITIIFPADMWVLGIFATGGIKDAPKVNFFICSWVQSNGSMSHKWLLSVSEMSTLLHSHNISKTSGRS